MSQYPTNYEQQAPGYGAPAVSGPSAGNRIGAVLALVGGAAAIVGAFLSWASIKLAISAGEMSQSMDVSVNGLGQVSGAPAGAGLTEGASDGYFVIAAGVLALVGGILALTARPKPGAIVAVIGGVAALGLGIYEMTQVGEVKDKLESQIAQVASSGVDANVSVSMGIGLWIIVIGGALALVGAVMGFAGGRKQV